jgi:hypothetical protein
MQSASQDGVNAARQAAVAIRDSLPADGLFAGQTWRIAPEAFSLGEPLARELDFLGRVLFQFYKSANLLYRRSVEGGQPAWVAQWLDLGKPADLVALQRHAAFRQDLPAVIRPDILLTDDGISITELDSVPGGIGLTAWLNAVYSKTQPASAPVIGGERGMLDGFAGIFGDAARVHIVVSEEAATYRPEMEYMARQLGSRFTVHDASFNGYSSGSAVYRFFELFDLANVPCAGQVFELAAGGQVKLTPPPKPLFEEKMLFALLWNRNLAGFWRQELGTAFFERLKQCVPYTWLLDPAPLPPHAAVPVLNLAGWSQLKELSQRERDLILKVSGFSDLAWGARGVHLGSDMSHADWAVVVDQALSGFNRTPYILQRFAKPRLVEVNWFDFARDSVSGMKGRARLCPYYFVSGKSGGAAVKLGGVLATICPADKKIIHGMTDAVLAPCAT